ncbi:MAG: hypothetical protein JWO29_1133 [Arthrobacter sp.]|nr:hypothetical protein [Arthrobacter sp.]
MTCITHGEPEASEFPAARIRCRLGRGARGPEHVGKIMLQDLR